VALEIECVDRLYLNATTPNMKDNLLAVNGQRRQPQTEPQSYVADASATSTPIAVIAGTTSTAGT